MPCRHRLTLWVVVLMVVGAVLLPVRSLAEPETKLYIGHAARLTALIPRDWSVEQDRAYDYAAQDGFVASVPLPGQSLDEACAALAAAPYFRHATTAVRALWTGELTCQVMGQTAATGIDATAVVMAHPYPFQLYNERYAYAAVIADPAHLGAIVATIDFAPDRVTPQAYVTSVLDLVEARAYWSDGVDWSLVREQVLADVDLLTSVEMAQGALAIIVAQLRAAGDNHSQVRLAGDNETLDDALGFGMLVGGRRVLAVYPDGPADGAGVRAGDLITQMDGRPFGPMPKPTDPGNGPNASSELMLERPGDPETISVTVARGPYRSYLPPSGRRLPGDIGLLTVPHFSSPGQQTAYATMANRIIAAVDQPATCGWVVDLRLNGGGSYSPMITAVGPILGTGVFFGLRYRDGRHQWSSYEDGRISDQDGREIADYLRGGTTVLQRPAPPVAVLIGPQTASAGEVTALAFVGRPEARLFGETTAGATTGNRTYRLFDGSTLALAEAAMTDRTGATHMDGVVPDEVVPSDWTLYGTKDDPVLVAARAWLGQQPACVALGGN